MFHSISTVASLAPILALLSLALPAQGKKTPRQKTFTCPMHPQIMLPAKGNCPICGMDLVRGPKPGPEKIKIPEGGLRDYCEEYLEKEMQGHIHQRQLGTLHVLVSMDGHPYDSLQAYAALKGKASTKTLRRLLESDVHYWHRAATLLGEMQDLASVPLLKKMLADPKLVISENWYCPKHPKVEADPGGKCKRCKAPLSVTITNESEQLSLAGALHEMGQAHGLQALEHIASQWYGALAYNALTRRDSPRVREILVEAININRELTGRDKAIAEAHRFYAICAQLRLGIDNHYPEAVRLLRTPDRLRKIDIIYSLGKSGLKAATNTLMDLMRDTALPWETRIAAARAVTEIGEEDLQGFLFGAFEKSTIGTLDRVGVYIAWAEVGDKRALPFLRAAIESGEARPFAVIAAARILGRMASKAKKK